MKLGPLLLFVVMSCTLLIGCSGDREPVNEGKDRPKMKKDK